jgi:capsular exopolysaccharide synthesis family protein
MAIGLGAGLLLGLAAYLYLGPAYQADTRILVSEKTSIPHADKSANLVGGRGEHVTLIRSDAIVKQALTDHGLDKLPAFEGAGDPIEDIIDGLTVTRSAGQETSKDNVFDIAYTHPDRTTAIEVVEAVVAAYRDFLSERQSSNAEALSRTLVAREKELKAEIVRLEQEHFEWRESVPPIFRSAPVVSGSGAPMAMPNRREQDLDRLSKLLQDNYLQQQEVQSKLATLKSMLEEQQPRDMIEFWIMHAMSSSSTSGEGAQGGGAGASILAGPPAKAAIDSQLLTARMLEARLLNVVGEDHEDVRKVRRQIEAIMSFYRQQGITPPRSAPVGGDADKGLAFAENVNLPSIYQKTLENQLDFLKNQEEALRTQTAEAETRAKEGSLLELEDQRWKDSIAAKKTELTNLTNQLVSFRQTKDSEGYTVQSIAQVRVAKSMKRLMKIVGACGMLGICAVFGLAYFREWYDNRVRTQQEVRQVLGSPVLGAVPHFETAGSGSTTGGVSAALCYFHRPGSREAESFRSVRTSLFATAKETGAKVIQISSPEPGDGKTTSASNLAVAIAQSGKRVLLVDADLRRPTVHKLFGLPQDVGLNEVLREEIRWEHALRETRVEGLSVLPAGQCPANPAELLSLGSLGQFLREARADFDYVLVDSPPLLAVSDPCVVAPHVDGFLLIVRMGKNTRSALARARETIETHAVPVYGVIANDFSPHAEEYSPVSYSEYYNTGASQPAPTASQQRPQLESV